MDVKIVFVTLLLLIGISGCTSSGRAYTACNDPRPEFCTREYRPVCAAQDTGQYKTYGNACTACADSQVTGYQTGACGAESPSEK